jgi:hypothetical protein
LQPFWKSWTFKGPDTFAVSLDILGTTGHDQISRPQPVQLRSTLTEPIGSYSAYGSWWRKPKTQIRSRRIVNRTRDKRRSSWISGSVPLR